MAERQGGTPKAPSQSARGDLSIGTLRLSVPGQDAAMGRRVAGRVGRELAHRIPPGVSGDFDSLHLRVQAPRHPTEWAVGGAITDAIVRALGRRR